MSARNEPPYTPTTGHRAQQANSGLSIPDAVAAARLYLSKGWKPIPLPRGAKGARLSWRDLEIPAELVETYFAPDSNIALRLGHASGGLLDCDLDHPTARQLAPEFLPATPMIHGRRSNPRSHWWYICPLFTENRRVFADPELQVGDSEPLLYLEARFNGHITVVPPSLNPSGEQQEWQGEALEPAYIEPADLLRACGKLAAACMLVQRWREGIRNDLSLALSGGLARAGWAVDDALHFLQVICAAAGDEEWRNRLEAVRATFRKVERGEPCTGLPTLSELLGERVAEQLSRWVGGQFEFRRNDGVLIKPVNPSNEGGEFRRNDGTLIKPVNPSELPPVVDLAEIQPTPTRWLVEGLIPAGFTTNLYGAGGAGKSLLALRLALSLLQGRPFLGHAVHQRAERVLYLDFEFDAERHAERWHAVCAGASLNRPPQGLLYLRVRSDFFSSVPELHKLVAHYAPTLIIIDSVGRAIVDPLDVKRVLGFYSTLDALQVSVLAIDHPPKPNAELGEEHGTEYGSAYKRYAARSVLQVIRGESRGNELGIRIRHAKANLDALQAETDVRIVFHKCDGLLERVEFFWGREALRSPELFGRKGEVLNYLVENNEGTASQIAAALGLPESTVRETLLKLERAGIVSGEGRPKIYRLSASPFDGSTALINSPSNRQTPAFEALLLDLQQGELGITPDEAAQLRLLWDAAAQRGFPRLQLSTLLILPGETAWLEGLRMLAATPQTGEALRLLSDLPPSNGGVIPPPDANGAGDSPSSPTDGAMKEELL